MLSEQRSIKPHTIISKKSKTSKEEIIFAHRRYMQGIKREKNQKATAKYPNMN